MAYQKVSVDFNGQPLTLETGQVARQADGSIIVTYGETKVLCTAVSAHSMREGQGFFPLTVNYQEKTYAAGKIPGSFFRREGRPSEDAILTCRLTDRPLRPLAKLGKGAALGTVLAFMMSVIALSLPEMIILRKVLKLRLIVAFAAIVAQNCRRLLTLRSLDRKLT